MAESGGLRGKGAASRATCPWCGRPTAVTWNKRTGEAYLRTHNDVRDRELNVQCVGSRRTVRRELLTNG